MIWPQLNLDFIIVYKMCNDLVIFKCSFFCTYLLLTTTASETNFKSYSHGK